MLRSIQSTIQAGLQFDLRKEKGRPSGNLPIRFVTISRQAGAGGRTLANDLAKAINWLRPDVEAWCAWDQELVDKVAHEHQLDRKSVEALENNAPGWFSDFINSLSSAEHPGEFQVYRRVVMSVRALATAGGAIIVGRGGVFITRDLPGGLHLRLVAPLDFREKRMAERLGVSQKEAALTVRSIDHARAAFYRRYWPGKDLSPESFTLTLNTAVLSEAQMVACLLPFIVGDVEAVPSGRANESTREQRRTASNHGGVH